MGQRRRGRGELEDEVLGVLGAAGSPLSAGAVREQLRPPTAYTTVLTTLVRLHRRGVLVRERHGRAHAYRLAEPAAAAAHRMAEELHTSDDRAVLLARFVDLLDGEDEPVLRALLDRAEATARTEPPPPHQEE